MDVLISRHIDASEQDAEGFYEYHYEYDVLVFSESGLSLTARSYVDTPNEVHFLRVETQGERRLLAEGDLRSKLLGEAIAYLRHQGKTEFNWLSGRGNGYEPVPL